MAALIYSIIILTNRGGADGAQPGFSSKSSSDLVLVPLQVRTCAAAPRRTEAFFNAQRLGQQEASRQEMQHSQVRRSSAVAHRTTPVRLEALYSHGGRHRAPDPKAAIT